MLAQPDGTRSSCVAGCTIYETQKKYGTTRMYCLDIVCALLFWATFGQNVFCSMPRPQHAKLDTIKFGRNSKDSAFGHGIVERERAVQRRLVVGVVRVLFAAITEVVIATQS